MTSRGLLLSRLRRELRAAGNPARAAGARAYMKSEMPFHGVPAVPFRALRKRAFRAVPLEDAEAWRALVLGVFRGALFREESSSRSFDTSTTSRLRLATGCHGT